MSMHGPGIGQTRPPLRADYTAPTLDITAALEDPGARALDFSPLTSSMPQCTNCEEKVSAAQLCDARQIRGIGAAEEWRAVVNARWPNVDPCVVRSLPYCPGEACPPPPAPSIPGAQPPDTYGLEKESSANRKAFMTFGILALVAIGGTFAIYKTTRK